MVSEFGIAEKTIYREMVSSVKEVNVKGVKLVRRAFLRWMKAAAGKKGSQSARGPSFTSR
jgi:hypothetical protein